MFCVYTELVNCIDLLADIVNSDAIQVDNSKFIMST